MFLTHPNPSGARYGAGRNRTEHPVSDQEALFKELAEDTLSASDAGTWEAELSAGADKKETFERLLTEGKLGYLALLRNLRNMTEAGCDAALVRDAIIARRGAGRVLPFRYIAAAKYAPGYSEHLDRALMASVRDMAVLPGKTVVLVDVSGSMSSPLSGKSDLSRMDAAAALAAIIPAEQLEVFTFSNRTVRVGAPRGLSGIAAIKASQPHSSTRLFEAVDEVKRNTVHDRMIVISDEQATYNYALGDNDRFPAPRDGAKAYVINVASAQNGVGYGRWTNISGFSENVLRYIAAMEAM